MIGKSTAVMQTRCISCKREQYGPSVYPLSHGLYPCAWCGLVPPVFIDEDKYREALKADRPPIPSKP